MKIIVDMMGGDNAPLAVLEGTAAAVAKIAIPPYSIFSPPHSIF